MFVFGVLVGAICAFAVVRLFRRQRYLAITEYWVYVPEERLPNQSELMDQVLKSNRYSVKGVSPIGPPEGLLFSDIRLHIALVLRRKNAHVFRPDLEYLAEPTAEQIQSLANSKALIKIRYASETPLKDARHVKLVTHLADAVAFLMNSKLIFDVTQERFFSADELSNALKEDPTALSPLLHTRTIWSENSASTRGLAKVGLRELKTYEIQSDERWLVLDLFEKLRAEVWDSRSIPENLDLDSFDDRFRLSFYPRRKGETCVRIHRIQTT